MNQTPAGLTSLWNGNELGLRCCSDDASFAPHMQGGGADESVREKLVCGNNTCIEGTHDLACRELPNRLGHEKIAQIAVRSEIARGNASDTRVTRQIYSVGNDGCGGIRHGRAVGEDSDG